MSKILFFQIILIATLITSCAEKQQKDAEPLASATLETPSTSEIVNPRKMLNDAYQQFKEGNDDESIAIANKVLGIGRETNNDTLIGGALSSLCRNAQRTLDTVRLAELSKELEQLSISSGDQKWMMKRAHMNAEMWRLIGNMERAEAFYNESMSISSSIGATGMFTIDHFNKSFVSTATGDYVEANRLITKYYALRREADSISEDAYGLIALAYLLEQKGNYTGAHEVAVVTRRLFEEQNLFPEPPDEKPLLMVEAKVSQVLAADVLEKISATSMTQSVNGLLEKYLTK
jgi:tetratricopeptide (TPR) repeat protein